MYDRNGMRICRIIVVWENVFFINIKSATRNLYSRNGVNGDDIIVDNMFF